MTHTVQLCWLHDKDQQFHKYFQLLSSASVLVIISQNSFMWDKSKKEEG